MNISELPNGGIIVHIPRPELERAGDISALLKELPEASDAAFYEIFDSPDGALVFARPRFGAPTRFDFADFESLLRSLPACPDGAISFLALRHSVYSLIIYPWNREDPPTALCEFAEPRAEHPNIVRHIAEHFRLLAGPYAIAELKSAFAK